MSSVLERVPRAGASRSFGCARSAIAFSPLRPSRILKQARPDLAIAVVVEDRFAAVFEGNPDVSEILPPELARLRRWRPDLCLNLHGGGRSAALTAVSGARVPRRLRAFPIPVALQREDSARAGDSWR